MYQDIRELLVEGNFSLTNDIIDKVQCVDGKIRMTNKRNRDRKDQQENREEVC